MGDEDGGRRRDGFAWTIKALGWTVGGVFCALFVVGLIFGPVTNRSSHHPLEDGFLLAAIGLCWGMWAWFPVWIAAVVSGWLVLVLTSGFPPGRERARRSRFAFGTAVGVGSLALFGLLWDSWDSRWSDGLTCLSVAALAAAVAAFSAWCYYPRGRGLEALESPPEGTEN